MKIVSFGPRRGEKPGLVHRDRIIDLLTADDAVPPTVRGILALGVLDRLQTILDRAKSLPSSCFVPLSETRLGPPVTNPSKIICLGLNYKDHAEEQNKKAPEWPLTFAKAPSALVGTGDPIQYPAGVTQLDHEVELAVYIGRRAKDVSLENAHRYIAGYSVFMDISARDLQYREKQFFRAKSFDGFGPAGPCLVTADDVADPHNLEISLEVNGQRFQSSNTGQMTFKAPYLVHYLSSSMTLEPGDIISTGTPSGVGVFADPPRFLNKGDVLVASIESLGTLTNPIV